MGKQLKSTTNPNKPYGFIYKTILPDGRYYLGQHKIISHITLDPYYFGSGVIIKDYVKSKGTDSLKREILAFGTSFDEMNLLEKEFVTEEILADPLNINLDNGGKNKFTRYPEIKERIGKTISNLRQTTPERWPSRKGEVNSNATQWKFISPDGHEFLIKGGFKDFCKSKGISGPTMQKAAKEGWIPKRGVCSGWQVFNLDKNTGTTRDTLNHGAARSGVNNPSYKRKFK